MANLHLKDPESDELYDKKWVQVKAVNIGTAENPSFVVPMVIVNPDNDPANVSIDNSGVVVDHSGDKRVKVEQGDLNHDADSVSSVDIIDGTKISGATDPNVTFDLNATTEQTIADIVAPAKPTKEYACTVQNTSANVDITIAVKTISLALNGSTLYNTLTTFSVAKGTSRTVILKGIFVGTDTRFTATPDAAISDADAANRKVTMRLRKM